MIETERLILRRYRAADLDAYAAMMADPEVADWLGGTLSRDRCEAGWLRREAAFDRLGFGVMVIERRSDGAFLGCAGLDQVGDDVPFAPAFDVGWRLARHAWGHGYATEAARAAIDDGFAHRGLSEITAITAVSNLRSRAVMERLGLARDPGRDFDHPQPDLDPALVPHVVYAASREAWAVARSMAARSGGPLGTSQLPPTQSTQAMANQSGAEAAVIPPVGQKRA
jgi:ribosomal-protein-alanine N-acetyltransferase